jgi:hypothetical protein
MALSRPDRRRRWKGVRPILRSLGYKRPYGAARTDALTPSNARTITSTRSHYRTDTLGSRFLAAVNIPSGRGRSSRDGKPPGTPLVGNRRVGRLDT